MHDDPSIPLSRVAIPMPVDLIARVDDWRFTNRIPSRAAAIRQLLETALANAKENHHAST